MFRAKMLANRRRHVLVLLDALMQVPARKIVRRMVLLAYYLQTLPKKGKCQIK